MEAVVELSGLLIGSSRALIMCRTIGLNELYRTPSTNSSPFTRQFDSPMHY